MLVIKKLIHCDTVTDIGIISLGKYTFLRIIPLILIQLVPDTTAVVKKFHGIKATIINIV